MTARHTDEFRATLADIDETLALLAGAGRDVTGLRMQRAALDDQGEPYRRALAGSTVVRSHATTVTTLWQHIQSLYITQQEIAMRADEISAARGRYGEPCARVLRNFADDVRRFASNARATLGEAA
jgi:hypothetical protein